MSANVPLVIDAMREADLAEVVAIERESFPKPWDEASFRAELGREQARCRVARLSGPEGSPSGLRSRPDEAAGGTLVGTLVYWLVAGEAELLNIATHPARRGQGIGRALIERLVAEAASAGASRVHLEVRRSNEAAIALYRRMGFRPSGVRRGYYQDDGEDALLWQLILDGGADE